MGTHVSLLEDGGHGRGTLLSISTIILKYPAFRVQPKTSIEIVLRGGPYDRVIT